MEWFLRRGPAMKIDDSNPRLVCTTDPLPVPVQSAPVECVDRVEVHPVQNTRLVDLLSSVPKPGAAELELSGKLLRSGGKARVFAERDASGEYLIRVEGKGTLAVGPEDAEFEAGLAASVTFRKRSAQEAEQLIGSLVAGVPELMLPSVETVEFSADEMVGILGLEAGTKMTASVDLKRNVLMTEQAAGVEMVGRLSTLLSHSGFEGELKVKVRTETVLPPAFLKRVASGEVSVLSAMSGVSVRHRIIVETEQRSEVLSLMGAGFAQLKKVSAEIDLETWAKDPLHPALALKGTVKTLTSVQQETFGAGFDVPGFKVRGRSTVYSVTEAPLSF